MKYREIEGDLIKLFQGGEFDLIAHQSNCFNTMGSGVALAIKQAFPQAYAVDLATEKGDIRKLGNYSIASFGDFFILNIYSQYRYGKEMKHTDYNAMATAFTKINHIFSGQKIGLPLIGCGSAGGDFVIVKELVKNYLSFMDVTIVKLPAKV